MSGRRCVWREDGEEPLWLASCGLVIVRGDEPAAWEAGYGFCPNCKRPVGVYRKPIEPSGPDNSGPPIVPPEEIK